MTYRELPDPQYLNIRWRMCGGRRQWQFNEDADRNWWWDHEQRAELWLNTPARIAVWTDLALNPLEP